MRTKVSLICVIALAIALFGCGKQPQAQTADHVNEAKPIHDHEHGEAHVSHGVEFKEGHGLTIPPITRQTLGLKIIDVQEGKATRRLELTLRVFERESLNGGEFVLASGLVDTNQVVFLKFGTPVRFETPESGTTLGKVVRVDPGSAKLTGLAEVIVRLPASDAPQVGKFLNANVAVATQEDVIIIPRRALLKTAEGYFVYVVNGDSFSRTKIDVAGHDGEIVEVTHGLYSGDLVVLEPIMPLWLAELNILRGGKACADGH